MTFFDDFFRQPGATDAALFAASVSKPAALSEVFDRHAPSLLRYLTRRLGPHDAEDALGDVFVVALERRASFDPGATSARPWLYGIASNLIARRHRDEVRFLRTLQREGTPAATLEFEDAAADRMDADRSFRDLAGALAELSTGDRDVLLLIAWAQLGQDEVASALEIPVGTVKSRLHRARRLLREQLDVKPTAAEAGETR
ncbi:RNA polymerase sigma factor [Mumia sp. ZJ1417]|uniref:RNA polymerase sigma factor n=1 Tax=Mumia sp. ZJ1417 TaxID=2708082 RepID=UPI001AB04A8D|nr:RNA polymerase sigma factor [Mumia sp. ZJ1417]